MKKHSDWFDYLPIAFFLNNSKHASTSFLHLYGISPITHPMLLNSKSSTPSNIIEHIRDIHCFIIEQLKIAKKNPSHYAILKKK